MILLTSPVDTVAHGWPAGIKLTCLCVVSTGLFVVDEFVCLALACLGVLFLYILPGWRFMRAGLSGLLVLWPFVVIVSLWHGIAGSYDQGLVVVLRLVVVFGLANLVTMTTHLTDMMQVVEWLATPLRWVGVRTGPLVMAVGLVVRMTPFLVMRATELGMSLKARSSNGSSSRWRMVLPLVLLMLDDAGQLILALRARGGVSTSETGGKRAGWNAM